MFTLNKEEKRYVSLVTIIALIFMIGCTQLNQPDCSSQFNGWDVVESLIIDSPERGFHNYDGKVTIPCDARYEKQEYYNGPVKVNVVLLEFSIEYTKRDTAYIHHHRMVLEQECP